MIVRVTGSARVEMLREVNVLLSLQSMPGRWTGQRLALSSATERPAEKAHNARATSIVTVAAEAAVLEAFGAAAVFEVVVDSGVVVADVKETLGRFQAEVTSGAGAAD